MLGLAPFEDRVYKKVIVQARYHTNLLAVERARAVCQEWLMKDDTKTFPQWAMSPVSLELKNNSLHRKFFVETKHAGAAWENLLPGDLKHQLQLAGNFLREVSEAIGDPDVTRFGVRFFCLLHYPDYDRLRDTLLRLCTRWDSFAEALQASDADVAVAWRFDVGAARLNASIAPIKRDELTHFFESTSAEDVPSERAEHFVPDAALFFDGDYAIRDQPFKAVRRIIKEAQETIDARMQSFLQRLGELDQKGQ